MLIREHILLLLLLIPREWTERLLYRADFRGWYQLLIVITSWSVWARQPMLATADYLIAFAIFGLLSHRTRLTFMSRMSHGCRTRRKSLERFSAVFDPVKCTSAITADYSHPANDLPFDWEITPNFTPAILCYYEQRVYATIELMKWSQSVLLRQVNQD